MRQLKNHSSKELINYEQKLSYERLTYFYPIYSDDYLVTIKKPLDALRDLDQNYGNGKELPSPSWLDLMKTVSEDDNPIIVKIIIKQ